MTRPFLRTILQKCVQKYYSSSGDRSYLWAARQVAEGGYDRILDVGCGNGDTWLTRELNIRMHELSGIEAHPKLADEARSRGINVKSFDLNGEWQFESNHFDAVHCTQVIEHLHNTRFFLSEMLRVMAPGGLAVLTSENLCSILNLSAMMLGYVPFSLQNVCGWYVGNPLGLHAGCSFEEHSGLDMPPVSSPSFPGVAGHVRVLSVGQARDLMERMGFVDVDVRSIGLMPLPEWLGTRLESVCYRRGHWLLMRGRKRH